MLDLKQECYLKCIPDYMALFRSAGGLQLFWDPTALLPFFREVLYPRISPPGHTTDVISSAIFWWKFQLFFALSDILEMSFYQLPSLVSKKGPPTQAKRAHRKGKDIKRSNKRFLYCAGVKKEEIYKVNQSRFINFLAKGGFLFTHLRTRGEVMLW